MTIDQLDSIAAPARFNRPEPVIVNGRYKIPDPDTGKDRLWTRASTWASTMDNEYALTLWKLRMTARGVAEREDLRVRIASIDDPTSDKGKELLDDLTDKAKEHAGAEYRSHVGSAIHEFLETLDKGERVPHVPPPYDADVNAYIQAKQRIGITVSPRYIERIVTCPLLGVAGKFDRVIKLRNSRLPLIADLKTGTKLEYSWLDIAIQLACYSRGATLWDEETRQHHKMLAVNQHQAVVFHLPAGEGKCIPYFVNLDLGWEAALLCKTVRHWRRRRDLAVLVEKAG